MSDSDQEDARSRAANAGYREQFERRKGAEAEFAFFPRWFPTGNWHATAGERIMAWLGGLMLLAAALALAWERLSAG